MSISGRWWLVAAIMLAGCVTPAQVAQPASDVIRESIVPISPPLRGCKGFAGMVLVPGMAVDNSLPEGFVSEKNAQGFVEYNLVSMGCDETGGVAPKMVYSVYGVKPPTRYRIDGFDAYLAMDGFLLDHAGLEALFENWTFEETFRHGGIELRETASAGGVHLGEVRLDFGRDLTGRIDWQAPADSTHQPRHARVFVLDQRPQPMALIGMLDMDDFVLQTMDGAGEYHVMLGVAGAPVPIGPGIYSLSAGWFTGAALQFSNPQVVQPEDE